MNRENKYLIRCVKCKLCKFIMTEIEFDFGMFSYEEECECGNYEFEVLDDKKLLKWLKVKE